jgi:hypothetical protein
LTGASAAVQLAEPSMPVTVKTAGVASLAFCGLLVTVPPGQVSVTLTVVVSVGPLSLKSLLTVKVALLSVLVIVQLALPPAARLTGVVQPEAV